MIKPVLSIVCAISLSACSNPAPKKGVMPGIAAAGYDAPSNAEASASYMAAFHARYDIPELEYPDDIKKRIRDARLKRMQKDMRVAAKRQEIMATLALTVLATKDPEAKELLEEIKNNPKASEDPASMNWMMELIDTQPKRFRLPKAEREKIYRSAVNDYKRAFRVINIEDCRWIEMKRLIGSGYEAMDFIHGDEPTHGLRCRGEIKIERRKGYPRSQNFTGDWIKSPAGGWLYYGGFRNVGIAARKQYLHPALLNNPEETIARQSFAEALESQLN